jgi:hypothetical protein
MFLTLPWRGRVDAPASMIRKSGFRFSEKVMLKQERCVGVG